MNETQEQFLLQVVNERIDQEAVCNRLAGGGPEKYSIASFRELLFAIDSLCRFSDEPWRRFLLEGCYGFYAGWGAQETSEEIVKFASAHGAGPIVLSLVVELRQPMGADRIWRELTTEALRVHFNETRGVSEYTAFVIYKWIDAEEANEGDAGPPRWVVERLVDIYEATLGLQNVERFSTIFAGGIRRFLSSGDETERGRRASWYKERLAGIQAA